MNYYDLNYGDYLAQNPAKKLKFYLDVIKKYAPDSSSIFEIGFGKGLFLKYAQNNGYSVSGCDINNDALKEGKDRLPGVNLFQNDFKKLNLSNLKLVAAFDVVEHVREPGALFKTIFNSVQLNGHFIFVCPVYDGPAGILVNWLDHDPTHIHKKSRFFWINLAELSGFKILFWSGIFRYLLPFKHYLHFEMKNFFRFFSPAIIVVCAKQ